MDHNDAASSAAVAGVALHLDDAILEDAVQLVAAP
jgi:hypothetical protein